MSSPSGNHPLRPNPDPTYKTVQAKCLTDGHTEKVLIDDADFRELKTKGVDFTNIRLNRTTGGKSYTLAYWLDKSTQKGLSALIYGASGLYLSYQNGNKYDIRRENVTKHEQPVANRTGSRPRRLLPPIPPITTAPPSRALPPGFTPSEEPLILTPGASEVDNQKGDRQQLDLVDDAGQVVASSRPDPGCEVPIRHEPHETKEGYCLGNQSPGEAYDILQDDKPPPLSPAAMARPPVEITDLDVKPCDIHLQQESREVWVVRADDIIYYEGGDYDLACDILKGLL